MTRTLNPRSAALCASLLTLCAVAALAVAPAHAQTLKPQTLHLPESQQLLPGSGPGAAAANANCLMCHSAGMVLTQPRLSSAAWLAEVNKMKNTFKAPIPDDQVQTIVDYLASLPARP